MEEIETYKCMLVRDRSIECDAVEDIEDAHNVFLALGMQDEPEEHLWMACLNAKCKIIGLHELSHGDIASSIVSMRSIFARALLQSAFGIILCHNPPSGDPTPSQEDISATKRVAKAAKMLDIKLFDHIIIGEGSQYTSMFGEGLL